MQYLYRLVCRLSRRTIILLPPPPLFTASLYPFGVWCRHKHNISTARHIITLQGTVFSRVGCGTCSCVFPAISSYPWVNHTCGAVLQLAVKLGPVFVQEHVFCLHRPVCGHWVSPYVLVCYHSRSWRYLRVAPDPVSGCGAAISTRTSMASSACGMAVFAQFWKRVPFLVPCFLHVVR